MYFNIIKNINNDFDLKYDFSVPDTGITVIYGRSGSGKTSLLNMVAGLSIPDKGSIIINNKNEVFNTENKINKSIQERKIGYVFQDARLFPHMNIEKNLKFGITQKNTSTINFVFENLIELFNLSQLLSRKPETLSGGEKQRVSICRALLCSPSLLLMDEPLASIDRQAKEGLIPYILKISHELSLPVLYVTHSVDEILKLSDTLVLIDNGSNVAVGEPEEIFSRLDLQPLTGRYDVGVVIRASINSHDNNNGFSKLDFNGGKLILRRIDANIGETVRLRIKARDVAISFKKPEGTSYQNIFKGKVMQISEGDGTFADIMLDIGIEEAPQPLWARISLYALKDLKIEVGKEVYAMIKAISVPRRNIARI